MNEAAMSPQYLAVMPVARIIQSMMCKDLAIIVGEYSRATDEEIAVAIDWCGTYETVIDRDTARELLPHVSTSDQGGFIFHAPPNIFLHQLVTVKCTIKLQKPKRKYLAYYDIHRIDVRNEPFLYFVNIFYNEHEIKFYVTTIDDMYQHILMHELVCSEEIPIVKILNARLQQAAIDYL